MNSFLKGFINFFHSRYAAATDLWIRSAFFKFQTIIEQAVQFHMRSWLMTINNQEAALYSLSILHGRHVVHFLLAEENLKEKKRFEFLVDS